MFDKKKKKRQRDSKPCNGRNRVESRLREVRVYSIEVVNNIKIQLKTAVPGVYDDKKK